MLVTSRTTRRVLLSTFLLVSSGCAASGASVRPSSTTAHDGANAEPVTSVEADVQASVVQVGVPSPPQAAPGTIARDKLVTTLDAGLGRFLGTVRVAPVLERGSFVGFRIVAFRDVTGLYEGVDLHPGDVVVRVNGSSIERPEQALAVWNGLRVTSELCVEYVRDGERREIRYPIVD